MDDAKRTRIIEVMGEIAKDMKNDAASFDGKPFNGKTMGEYMGNHGAAIAALANAVVEILAEEKELKLPPPNQGEQITKGG